MWSRRLSLFLAPTLALLSLPLNAQEEHHRGRKYKAPPQTSHVEVLVTKKLTGKPIVNAAVVFRAIRDGKDDGNLEVKTDPEGKAAIDVIATGSTVRVQVIADGYSTYAEEYLIDQPSREIHIDMLKPREQVSAYVDNSGKASSRKAGVQEAEPRAKTPAPAPTLQPRTTPPPPAPSNGSGDQPAPSASQK